MMQMNHEQRVLVEGNMGLVGAVIKTHVRDINHISMFTYDDIFQIGCVGLCKAALNSRSEAAKFSTFAYICIRNEIFGALEYAGVRKRREMILAEDNISLLERESCWDGQIYESHADELYGLLSSLKAGSSGIVTKGIDALQLHTQGYNYREIGEMMGGVPAKNVTAWVSRARKYLREQPALLRLKEDVA